ncbi:MAG TPA: hypothetical protein VI215_02160 [Bacteroidota bacterium]|jgi:hypothetical protein
MGKKDLALILSILGFSLRLEGQEKDEFTTGKGSGLIRGPFGAQIITRQSIPRRLSYQGLLTTSSGTPVPDGSYNLKFEIYNLPAGGTLRFAEIQNGTPVVRGTFSVMLGSITPLTAIFSESLYVQVTALAGPGIGSPQVFSPRSELTSAPYSLAPWAPADSGIFYNGGQVGLGTPNPGKNGIPYLRLDLQDEDGINSDINIGVSGALESIGGRGWPVLNFSKSRGSTASPLAVQRNDFLGEVLFWGYDGLQYRQSSRILSVARGTPGLNNVSSQMVFYTRRQGDTAITRALTIDTSQNIGIGLITPAYKVDVNGTINATAFRGDGSQLTNLPTGSSQWTTNGSNIYYNLGSVGIGTSTPGQQLTVSGPSATIQLNSTSSSANELYFTTSGTARGYMGVAPAADQIIIGALLGDMVLRSDNQSIRFSTNAGSGSAAVITSTGNVGIGTTTPAEKLEVAGNIKIGSATIHSGTGSPEGVVSGNVGDLYLRTDGGAGSTMYVKESGNATNTGWAGK